ncbi:MAG: hypothetical protein J5I93_30540 [Pirellulaceae bacterium]|nr:hypothetical protein [Pirellulaceae bacterium]
MRGSAPVRATFSATDRGACWRIERTIATLLATLLGLAMLLPAGAAACETPVYRYAMYRWQPAPYEVYFLRTEAASERQRMLQQQLTEWSRDKLLPANVLAFDVDLAEPEALERVPADVKSKWLEQTEPATPACLVTSPLGFHLHTGPLESFDLEQLVTSPVRKALASELAAGKAGVFLLLPGSNAEQNEAARGVLRQLVADISAGKVQLYSAPAAASANPVKPAASAASDSPSGTPDQPAEQTAAPPATPPALEIGLLEVQRDDPQEQWLVRSLLAVEDDLAGLTEPMVFAVYGRARALPPYVGRGISRENLVECVEFITGACSCTVKEQNPGVDLLVRYDWEGAAAALAEKFGTEEGNETQFGGSFLPELIVPRSGPVDSPSAAGQAPPDVANSGATVDQSRPANSPEDPPAGSLADSSASSRPEVSSQPGAPESNLAANSAESPAVGGQEEPETESVGPAAASAETDPQLARATTADSTAAGQSAASTAVAAPDYSLLVMGGGLVAALVLMFVVTLVVLRPR